MALNAQIEPGASGLHCSESICSCSDAHGELPFMLMKKRVGVFEDKATKNLFAGTRCKQYATPRQLVSFQKTKRPLIAGSSELPRDHPGQPTQLQQQSLAHPWRHGTLPALPSTHQLKNHLLMRHKSRCKVTGAPENCVQWITQPSMEATILMNHEGVGDDPCDRWTLW